MDPISSYLNKYRTPLFILTISLFVIAGVFLNIPPITGKLQAWNMESNPEYRMLLKKDSIFSYGKKIYILVEPENDSLAQVFNEVRTLKKELEEAYPEARIISPTTFYTLMIRHWKSGNSLAGFLEEGNSVPLLKQIIARDKQSFLLVFSMTSLDEINVEQFDRILSNYNRTISAKALSEIHLAKDISQTMRFDIKFMIGLIVVFFLLYMAFTLRNLKAIIYPLVLITLSILTTINLFSILGLKIEIISILSIPIVLILALSDGLHLLSGYNSFPSIKDRSKRVEKTLKLYIIPSFFSSFTTAVAFFSFYLFSDSMYVREFGLVTSIALMLEFVITFLVSPFLLYWTNIKSIRSKSIVSVALLLYRYRMQITIMFGIITITSLFFIKDLKIESSMDSLFPRGSNSADLNKKLKENYFNVLEASLIITPEPGVGNTSFRREVAKITKECKSLSGVVNVNSATNSYMFRNRMGIMVDLFRSIGGKSPYHNDSTNQYLVECQFENAGQIHGFTKYWRNKTAGSYKIEVASSKLMMDQSNRMTSLSILKSLAIAGLNILVIILLLSRSFTTSLLGLIPNLIPIALIILIYAFFDLELNMITSLTLVIGLGLLDDDTIHIIYRKLWLKKPLDELNFSIISTSLILSVGFLFFGVSKFFPVQQFGYLAAIIFLFGVFCELTVTVWILDYIVKKGKR